jgi:hypothetical protein
VHMDPDQAIADWAYHDGSTGELNYNGGEWFVRVSCAWEGSESGEGRRIASYLSTLPNAIEVETVWARL